jgi:CubicO group peptidase (beta-lactamase class C family)
MRPAIALVYLAAALMACPQARSRAAGLPATGVRVPEFAELDETMQNYMQLKDISAGMAAVMRNGVPIYHRTFGWKDQAKTVPLQPDTVMRLASVTKPLTAAAVRKLVTTGEFSLNSRVFSIDGPGSGLLDHVSFGVSDPRLRDVTVNHLCSIAVVGIVMRTASMTLLIRNDKSPKTCRLPARPAATRQSAGL